MTPNDIDLIYSQHGTTRKMCACTADWLSTEVDSKGAFGPLAKEVMGKFPTLFSSEVDAQNFLTVRHFHNMSRGRNCAGLAYPTVLDVLGAAQEEEIVVTTYPSARDRIWECACGEWMRDEETECHKCKVVRLSVGVEKNA